MYIEIKEIGPDGLAVSRSIEAFRLPLSERDSVQVDTVHLNGELNRDKDGISFVGRIETSARLSCSRCLEEYSLPLDLPFDLFYTTEPEGTRGADTRLDDDMVTRVHYDGVRIDVRSLLSEQVYLGLPLKPLCRTDCLGLCPRCGTNLNTDACACAEERSEDPRLRVLKNLL
jgi:DUF177 domain-containing protein